MQFITTLTGQVISWPVGVVLLVLILRQPIRESLPKLMDRILKAKVLGQEVEFTDKLERAERKVEHVVETNAAVSGEPATTGESSEGAQPDDAVVDSGGKSGASVPVDITVRDPWVDSALLFARSTREAREDPSGAVMRAWSDMEHAIISLSADVFGHQRRGPANPTTIALRQLEKYGVIDGEFVDSVRQIRNLRNEIAHGKSVASQSDALQYLSLVGQLIGTLHSAVIKRGDRARKEWTLRQEQVHKKRASDAAEDARRDAAGVGANGTAPPNEPDLSGPARPDER